MTSTERIRKRILPYEGSKPYIFVSYARKDENRVLPFLEALQQADYRIWYDAGIKPGEIWNHVIATHVKNCGACLAFISANSGGSQYCDREIQYAVSQKKSLVPFFLEEDVHLSDGTEMIVTTIQSLKLSKCPSPQSLLEELADNSHFRACNAEYERLQREEEKRQETERLERERQERSDSHQWTSQPRRGKHDAPISPPPRQNIMDEVGDIRLTITQNDLIGYDKYSQVYKGELGGSGRTVAVKVYTRPLLRLTRQQQDEFSKVKRKIEWLKELKHSRIAEFIDWIPDFQNNRSYIVMQYIEGRGLNRELADKGPFRQARVLNWAIQILDAMQYLHNKRYIIGTLDPSNIVLTPEDNVCLVDFKYLSDIRDTFFAGVKYHGRCENTLEGNQALENGMREDIRYFGATLFELLTGQKPDSLDDAQRKEALDRRGVADSVTDIIFKAMSPEAENRYASAAEMKEALRSLPARDRHARSQMLSLAAALILSAIMFIMGVCFYNTGLKQYITELEQRAKEAGQTVYAEGASDAFSDTPSTETRRDSDAIPNEGPTM